MLFVFHAIHMLRSIFFSTICHVHVSRSTCWLRCLMLLKPFYHLISLFLVFWPSLVGCRSRSYGLGLHPYTLAHIKRFGSFPLCIFMFTCLLLCFMSMLASLDLGFAMLYASRRLFLVWLHLSLLGFV